MTSSDELILDLIPAPVPTLETEIVDRELLLYEPHNTRAVYLNSTAAVIWALCDARRSVREITRLISENYPDADNIVPDITVTLDQLQKSGVLVLR